MPSFEGHSVRTVLRDGEPWFVAADVCAALNLQHHKGSYALHLDKLDDDERTEVDRGLIPDGLSRLNMEVWAEGLAKLGARAVRADDPLAVSNAPTIWLVSESGLYTLILRSREATRPGTLPHRFRRWVTREVLPALRRAAQGQPTPAGQGHIHLDLEAPGRYLVSTFAGKPVHVQRMSVLSVGRDMRANDVEVLALNIQLMGSLWRRLGTLHSLAIPIERGFTEDQFDRAITNAEQVAGQFLRAMREQPEDSPAP